MVHKCLWLVAFWLIAVVTTCTAQINFGDMTGGCDPTVDPSQQCGGHGTCDPISRTCACENLWSQRADFIDSQDCPTSLVATYVLWGLNVVEILWVLYSTAYVLLARAENYFEQKKVKRDYSLWKNKGLIAVLMYFTICMPCHLAMAILHLVDPVTRVAFEIFPTLLFIFGKAGLYFASVFLQGPLIAAVLHGRSEHKSLIRKNYMLNFMVSAASITIGCFSLITLDHFQSNLPKQIEVMRAYYFCQALALIFSGIQAMIIKKMIYRALDQAAALVSSGDKTEHLKRKVDDLQGQIMKQGMIQGSVYIIMGAVPFLLNKHAYFLPISWLAMPILGKRLAFQFDLDKAGAKTIAARLGLKKSSAFENSTTGSKKRKDGEGSFNPDVTQRESENPSYNHPPSQFTSAGPTPSNKKGGKQSKNQKKNDQVLSVAISDEEGGMHEIMKDEKGALRDKFTDFVRSKYATEALVLYDACVKYQNLAASGSSQDALASLGREIVNDHIRENASQPVDMSADLRNYVLGIDESNSFGPDSFDRVKTMAFNLLKSNFYHHFAKSLLT